MLTKFKIQFSYLLRLMEIQFRALFYFYAEDGFIGFQIQRMIKYSNY